MNEYNPQEIEPKWQKEWADSSVFKASDDSPKAKFYCLNMFPYPSGSGLHVGHVRNYVGNDVLARFHRMQGQEVLFPMGFDSFGLPAENYAIKTGTHPRKSTEDNIKNFKGQLKRIGLSYNWDREINTSKPEYYKWTQWLFLKLYEAGLAYRKEEYVNWDPEDKTVLANEQVIDGRSERSGAEVEQKKMTQWFFKITEFADELLEGLDELDWPESTKKMQSNWIGRSEGHEIEFEIAAKDMTVKTYTTRLDTIFGATFMVLAPEHPRVDDLMTDEQKSEVNDYLERVKTKTKLERQALDKNKSGVFSGSFAINPATSEEIPIWIADFVLMDYGTGAIMAVPAHDARDHQFAKEHDLEIRRVVQGGELPYEDEGELTNSEDFDGTHSEEAKESIAKHLGAESRVRYKLRDWLISRQRYWGAPIPIVYDEDGDPHPVDKQDLPVELPEDVDFEPTGVSPLEESDKFHQGVEGKYGEGYTRETDTMDTFVDSSWYYLRYCDPQNGERFAGEKSLSKWMPVDLYVGGSEHATTHLLFARFITKFLHREGYIDFDEPFTKLRHQGFILAEDGEKMSKSKGNVVNPDDVIEGFGADTMRTFEMFVGPFSKQVEWSTEGLKGVSRFLNRVYSWAMSDLGEENSEKVEQLLAELIHTTEQEIENMKFNTAVAHMMEFLNEVKQEPTTAAFRCKFVKILSLFAPHLSEELWDELGGEGLVSDTDWPTYSPEKLERDTVKVPVQINGEVRAVLQLSPDATQDEALNKALEDENVNRHLSGHPDKIIYVPGEILNLVANEE